MKLESGKIYSKELMALYRYIALLHQYQKGSRYITQKLFEYIKKNCRKNNKFIVKVKQQRKIAIKWMWQDLWSGRPNLSKQIDYLLKLANIRIGNTCIQIMHLLFNEQHYFQSKGATALANSTWQEALGMQHYVHVVGRAMKRSCRAYQHSDYYHAYVYASKLRHLLSLAKPAKNRQHEY